MFVVYFEKQQGTTRDETNRFYNQDKLKKRFAFHVLPFSVKKKKEKFISKKYIWNM